MQNAVGYALYSAEVGLKHGDAVLRRGLGENILEVVSRADSDTFRAVYTVRFKAAVDVLHAFRKKVKQGIATPKQEIDLVRHRLGAARRHGSENHGGG